MKATKALLAIMAAMVWLCCPGIAAAQISWSDQNYNSLASANAAATIPPGTRITAQNWQQYKDFMPVGLQDLWAGKSFWHLPADAVMVVGATTPTPLPKQYQEDTEKYASQVSLIKNSEGGYDIKGYVAGAPFPNPSGPLAGVQMMYNEYYAYIPYLITTYAHLGFDMDQFGST